MILITQGQNSEVTGEFTSVSFEQHLWLLRDGSIEQVQRSPMDVVRGHHHMSHLYSLESSLLHEPMLITNIYLIINHDFLDYTIFYCLEWIIRNSAGTHNFRIMFFDLCGLKNYIWESNIFKGTNIEVVLWIKEIVIEWRDYKRHLLTVCHNNFLAFSFLLTLFPSLPLLWLSYDQ